MSAGAIPPGFEYRVAAPVNTVAPVASGTVTIGGTLSTTNGTWTGASTFTYQWQRAGVDIGGATANTYTPVAADMGPAITCVVTAANTNGVTASASSNSLTYTTAQVTTRTGEWNGGVGVTDDGAGGVTAWADQSGNGNTFAVGASTKPTEVAVNGVTPCPVFGGASTTKLTSTNNESTIIHTTAYHVVCVLKPSAIVGVSATPYLNDGVIGDTGDWWGLYLKNPNIALGFHFDSAARAASASGLTVGVANCVDWKFDGTTISIRVAAGAYQTAAATTIGNGLAFTTGMGRGTAAGNVYQGPIAYMLTSNAVIAASQLADLRAYLTNRFGVTT